MKKRTLSTAWIRTISTGVFAALFAVVLLTLVMPTQAKAVCDVHSWGNWWTVQQPGCTTEGMEARSCHNCDTNEERAIPATGHRWDEGRVNPRPTCTENGRKIFICLNCKAQEYDIFPALGHSWGAWQTTDATCIADGEKVRRCTVCADGVERESIPALGHDMVTVATHPATCMNRGYTELKCTRCDYTDTNEGTYGEHVMGKWQTTTQPTCTTAGEKRRTCTVCGKAPEKKSISALGHDMVAGETVTGTCIREGYTSLKCSRCGYEEKTSTGYGSHVMGKWQTTTQPTCTAAGEKRRTCTVCGKAPEKKSIPALGHDMVVGETVTGTCIREGYTSKKCSRCGHEEKTSTGYGAHVWGEWEITIPATCTTEGERRHMCVVCQVAGETLEYPALGHNMVAGETVTGTCIREGYTSKKCSRCGYEEKTSTGYGSHVMGEWQTTTQPTCTGNGERQRNCTVCSKVPEKETIPANGHRWGAWYVKTPAEIGKDGLEERDCQVCGSAETRPIPALAGETARPELTVTGTSDPINGSPVKMSIGAFIIPDYTITNTGNVNLQFDKIYVNGKLEGQFAENLMEHGDFCRMAYGFLVEELNEAGSTDKVEISIYATAYTEDGQEVRSNTLHFEYPLIEDDPTFSSRLLVEKVMPDGFATTIGADIPVQYKVTNTGNTPITIETSYHQADNGAKQAVNMLNGKVLQPSESAVTAVFVHHVNGFFQVASINQRPDETWLTVYVTGKTQSGEAVRSNLVHFSYSKAEDGETEPKLVLSIVPQKYPNGTMLTGTVGKGLYLLFLDVTVTNTGDEPITLDTDYWTRQTGDVYDSGSDPAFRGWINFYYSAPTLQPGESRSADHTLAAFCLWQIHSEGETMLSFSHRITGITESGKTVSSNTERVWWPITLKEGEDSEESTTEPKLVMTKISPDGYPVHMSKKYTHLNCSFEKVDVIWSVTNVSSEPIKITLMDQIYPSDGNVHNPGSIPMDKTLLPGESYTSKELGFSSKYYIINPWYLIENGGEYSTWNSWVATGVTESGEEVTSNTITFNWPVILDEDPDDPTNDPTIDPDDPTHNPDDPNDPQNMAASLSVVKAEASAPANGQHYAAGEEITFSITYQNVSDKPISNIHIYDALAGLSWIVSADSLAPGESRSCSFSYRVTAADVNVYGYVANTAFATYQDGGLTRNARSNRVVVILNPDIVPPDILDRENPDDPDDPSLVPIITIGDPDNPFDPEHPEEYEGPFGLPGMQGEDHCELIVKNHTTGTTDFDQHYCAAHQSTRTAVQAMTGAAATPAVSLSAWTYARTLWQNDCNVLLEKLYSCANDPAKAIIMEENLAFESMVTMREAALNVLYPDQPEKVAEEIAKLYEDRCIELCYMLHTLPKAKPVEAASTEMFMMSGDGSICRTEFTGDAGADVFYTEALCSQHAMTDMMTGFVLNGTDDLATATKQIGLLWRSELRTEMDIIRGALSDENAAIITYDLGTTRIWLEAREALLQLLYPKQEAAVTNIINDTIKQRVTTLCEEANK